ncbi:MAG: hypothetical protein Fur0020_13680 [Thermodesulfovibrionia bacterium]
MGEDARNLGSSPLERGAGCVHPIFIFRLPTHFTASPIHL